MATSPEDIFNRFTQPSVGQTEGQRKPTEEEIAAQAQAISDPRERADFLRDNGIRLPRIVNQQFPEGPGERKPLPEPVAEPTPEPPVESEITSPADLAEMFGATPVGLQEQQPVPPEQPEAPVQIPAEPIPDPTRAADLREMFDAQPVGAVEVNPIQEPEPPEVSVPGHVAKSIVQGAARILADIPKAMQLWLAPDPKVLDWMDQVEAAEAAGKDTSELMQKMNLATIGVRNSPYVNQFTRKPGQSEEELLKERFSARYKLLGELKKTAERPLYQLGVKFDEWVRDTIPTNPELRESFWLGMVPEGFGSMLGFSVIFATTKRITKLPPTVVTAGAGVTVQQAAMFQDALNSGADIEEAFASAYALETTAAGASEALPIAALFNRVDKATGGVIKRGIKRMMIEGSEEAAQEAFQDIMSNLVAAREYDPDRQLWGTSTTEGAAVGFTTGAIMEFLMSVAVPGRMRGGPDIAEPSLEDQMEAARQEALAAGGDALAATLAASEVASRIAGGQADMFPIEKVTTEGPVEPPPPAAPSPAAPPAAQVDIEEQIMASEVEETYAAREETLAGKREAQVQEAEYQRDIQVGEERAAVEEAEPPKPKPVTIGEAIDPEAREGLERLREAKAARVEEEAAPVAEAKEPAQLEDTRADFAVTPEGEAIPRAQQGARVPREPSPTAERPFTAEEVEAPVEPGAAAETYPLAPREEWYGEADYEARGASMIEMTPDEFLAEAAPLEIDEVARDNIDDLKQHMESGRTLDPASLYEGKTARDSDGRHRAIAAKELGMATIPVLDFRGKAVPVEAKANEAATSPTNELAEPTQAQKEAGNYKKGHLTPADVGVPGVNVTIENPAGSTRSGVDREGKPWTQKMKDHYGYIKGTESAEGETEQLDVFIGEDPDSRNVFVVDQVNPGGAFDEHKVMVGYTNQLAAVRAYKRNYPKGTAVGPVTSMSKEQFTGWLDRGDQTQALNPDLRTGPVLSSEEEFQDIATGQKRKRGRKSIVRFRTDEKAPERTATHMSGMFPGAAGKWLDVVLGPAKQKVVEPVETEVPPTTLLKVEEAEASPTEGIDVKQAKEAIKPLTDAMPRLNPIVLEKPSDAPAELYREIRRRKALKAKGVYYDGKLYIFASNHSSVEDVVRTLLHEGVAHLGLRAVLPETELNDLLDEVYESMDETDIEAMRKRSRAYADIDLTTEEGQRELAEEHIAHLAEVDPQSSFVQRVVAMIRTALRRAGVTIEWSNDDIHALLNSVRRELRKTVPLDRITVTSEVEVAETGEIIEVEEQADKAVRQLDKRMGMVQRVRECMK